MSTDGALYNRVSRTFRMCYDVLMPNWRRDSVPGGSFFFTVVTDRRARILNRACRQDGRVPDFSDIKQTVGE